MTTYPNLNIEPYLLKIKMGDDEYKNLKNQTEKHDHEKIIKSHKIDNDFYRKKYNSLNKKKVLIIITEVLIGSGSAITSSTLGLINPSAGLIISSGTALLTSTANLITNEYVSKLKKRCTKLRGWINVITLLYEKTLKTSMVDKKIDEKEAEEVKKICNRYIDEKERDNEKY